VNTHASDGNNGTNGTGPEQIEADIARQREELATTVNQLQAKLDVKSRVQEKAAELKDRATTASGRPRPDLTVAAVAALALVVGLVVWRRRH
jgi:MYXO-CTERM domain-containing protein